MNQPPIMSVIPIRPVSSETTKTAVEPEYQQDIEADDDVRSLL